MSFLPTTRFFEMPEKVETLQNLEAGLLAPTRAANLQAERSPHLSKCEGLSRKLKISVFLSTLGFLTSVVHTFVLAEGYEVGFSCAAAVLFTAIFFISLLSIKSVKYVIASFNSESGVPQSSQTQSFRKLQALEDERERQEAGGEASSESKLGEASTESDKAATSSEGQKLLQPSTGSDADSSSTASEVATGISKIASEAIKAMPDQKAPETKAKDAAADKDPTASDLRRRKLLNLEAVATAAQSSDEDATK